MSKRWQWVLGAVLAIALVSILFRIAEFGKLDFSGFNPINLTMIAGAYAGGLFARALLMRITVADGTNVTIRKWIGVSGQHQLMFTLAPSGLGDLGFPGLAERITGIKASRTIPALIAIRMRDVLILAAAGLAGLGQIFGFPWPFYGLSVGLVALQFALPLIPALVPDAWWTAWFIPGIVKKWANGANQNYPNEFFRLIAPGLLLLTTWSMSLLAIYLAFQTLSLPLHFLNLLFILTVLNVVGAIGLTVAGLGISEAGLAGALILLGFEPATAVATSLSVRPLILAGNLLASIFLAIVYRITK